MQEVARSKVLKAFRAALRYMDEATLQASVAVHLQLQPSPNKEEAQAEAEAAEAQCAGPSLQAPQALSCPRRPRTRRCPRPASAALQGLARQPSLGRPVSAPAECPGQGLGSNGTMHAFSFGTLQLGDNYRFEQKQQQKWFDVSCFVITACSKACTLMQRHVSHSHSCTRIQLASHNLYAKLKLHD